MQCNTQCRAVPFPIQPHAVGLWSSAAGPSFLLSFHPVPTLSLCLSLSVCLSICLSVYLSFCLPGCLSVSSSICLLSAATQILLKFLVRFSVKLIFIRLLGHNQIAEACTLNSKKHQRYLFEYLSRSLSLSLTLSVSIYLQIYILPIYVCVYIFNLISGANASAIQIPEPRLLLLVAHR